MRAASKDEFVRAYEEMVTEVERVLAQYPEEMHEDLREHAQQVINARMMELWKEHQRRRALLS